MGNQLQELCHKLDESGVRLSHDPDKRIWRGDTSGEFSVASTYRLLNNGAARVLGAEVI